jgi:hypothetical protein
MNSFKCIYIFLTMYIRILIFVKDNGSSIQIKLLLYYKHNVGLFTSLLLRN